MKLFTILPKNVLFFLAPVSFFLLASCGSYQYSGYEDGIYGEGDRGYDRPVQNATQKNSAQEGNNGYYKKLFAEEAALYGEVLSENSIFTDVDSYTSTGGDYQPGEQQSNYAGGNAPWGNDPDSYTINIYNHGYYGGFFHPYWGGGLFAYDPFWGPGYYAPGYWGPGYWGPGYWGNSWRIGFGFGGFGFGGHYGYAGHPYLYGGGGWYNPYNYYGNRYNNFRKNVAYATGRRDAVSTYRTRSNNTSVRSAIISDSRGRTSSYSRSIRNMRSSNDDYGTTRRTVGRDYDTRRSTDYNTSRTQTRTMSPNRTSSGVYSRTQNPSSNTGTVRSSSPSRSSGTVRSSSGSGRSSSGGTTSSRGRGN